MNAGLNLGAGQGLFLDKLIVADHLPLKVFFTIRFDDRAEQESFLSFDGHIGEVILGLIDLEEAVRIHIAKTRWPQSSKVDSHQVSTVRVDWLFRSSIHHYSEPKKEMRILNVHQDLHSRAVSPDPRPLLTRQTVTRPPVPPP